MPKTTRNEHVSNTENVRRYQKALKEKGGQMLTMIMKPEDVDMLRLVWTDANVATRSEAIREALKFYIEKKQLG